VNPAFREGDFAIINCWLAVGCSFSLAALSPQVHTNLTSQLLI